MKYVAILLFIFSLTPSFAQSDEAMKKIQSARIALITERLDLSPEQAEKFWPIYNQYSKERMALRKEMQQTRRGMDKNNLSDEESKVLMQKSMELREKELRVDQDYSQKFQKVITAQQIVKLRGAEDDFNRMLRDRLEQRRQKQQRQQQMMERRQQQLQQRNN